MRVRGVIIGVAVASCLSYAGTVEFRRRLHVNKATKAGPIVATCTLGYQACDPFSCRPPAEAALEVKVDVVE